MASGSRPSRIVLGALAVAVLWGGVGGAFAYRTRKAMRSLTEATMFIGGDRELRWLVRLPGLKNWFSDLARGRSAAGRLYGVCGLYLADERRGEAARKDLVSDHAEVVALFGCLGSTRAVSDLASELPQLCRSFRAEPLQLGRLTGR
jgi:hypothetical protein